MNSAPGRGAATDDARGSRAVDQFMYIQQRLRELGANYYLLENWGDQGECYRFHCRVAVLAMPTLPGTLSAPTVIRCAP